MPNDLLLQYIRELRVGKAAELVKQYGTEGWRRVGDDDRRGRHGAIELLVDRHDGHGERAVVAEPVRTTAEGPVAPVPVDRREVVVDIAGA